MPKDPFQELLRGLTEDAGELLEALMVGAVAASVGAAVGIVAPKAAPMVTGVLKDAFLPAGARRPVPVTSPAAARKSTGPKRGKKRAKGNPKPSPKSNPGHRETEGAGAGEVIDLSPGPDGVYR